jgi:hypothetical protein
MPDGFPERQGLYPSVLPAETCSPQYLAQKSRSAKSPTGGQGTRLTPQWQNFEFDVDDDVAIRRQQPLPAYDDKGQPRKYTTVELNALKGSDASIPGYPADFADLKPGRTVTLHLVQRNDPSSPNTARNGSPRRSGQLTATVVRVDEKKRKLKIHVESLTIGQARQYRLNSRDAGSTLLAEHRISAIVIATTNTSRK